MGQINRIKQWYQKLPAGQKVLLGAAMLYVGIALMTL